MPKVSWLDESTSIDFDQELQPLEHEDQFKFGCKTGKCGMCRVKVIEGADSLTPLTIREKKLFDYLNITDTRNLWRMLFCNRSMEKTV